MAQVQISFPDDQSGFYPSKNNTFSIPGLSCFQGRLTWFRGKGPGLSEPTLDLKPYLEADMESLRKNIVKLKTGSFPAVSIFLKWYLCRTTLEKSKPIKKMLDEMDAGKAEDQEKWADLLRERLLREALHILSSLLERPVNQNELLHIYERIEEFIQLYAIGLKT